MNFVSTRGASAVTFDDALLNGIAADGGLFFPEVLPQFHTDDFADSDSMLDIAKILLTPFFAGSQLADELDSILHETFNFPILSFL